jgi:hypothetical protein
MGLLAVADWWLAMNFEWEGEMDAAAAPARTTVRAKKRIAVFMVSEFLAC